MAGHSQFKNIMHRKGAQDARRAKQFTKVAREIIVAARLGDPDPDTNPRLRTAIQNARAVNMPNDRIKKAIDTAIGAGDSENYEEIRYEGYGAGGVAFIIDALTDNKNRTAAEMRAAFTRHDGNLGESNSVSFMFDRVGRILFSRDVAGEDAIFEAAAEAGAINCETAQDYHEIITDADDLAAVRDALAGKFGEPEKANLSWQPQTCAQVSDDQAATVLKLIDVLEDNDDVQYVTTNIDITDETAEKLLS